MWHPSKLSKFSLSRRQNPLLKLSKFKWRKPFWSLGQWGNTFCVQKEQPWLKDHQSKDYWVGKSKWSQMSTIWTRHQSQQLGNVCLQWRLNSKLTSWTKTQKKSIMCAKRLKKNNQIPNSSLSTELRMNTRKLWRPDAELQPIVTDKASTTAKMGMILQRRKGNLIQLCRIQTSASTLQTS